MDDFEVGDLVQCRLDPADFGFVYEPSLNTNSGVVYIRWLTGRGNKYGCCVEDKKEISLAAKGKQK
tara:strand:- start:133 stop:330 length:198 start_codon:yes stop_codon:yes gene_type:complete